MKKLCYAALVSFAIYFRVIRGDEKVLNILNFENSEKHGKRGKQEDANLNQTKGTEELNLLKKYLNENNMDAALKVIEALKSEYDVNNNNIKIEPGIGSEEKDKQNAKGFDPSDIFNGSLNVGSLKQMMKFYSYVQGVLNSQSETSEKKIVRSFLRKSFQNMKKGQTETGKQSLEEIIKKTEGHKEILEKLADIMQIDQEQLQNEEIRNSLNKILVGILKFIDYTNNSSIVENLLEEIEIKDVDEETETTGTGDDGKRKGPKKRLHVNLQNSKAHLEMLQKASDYMGLNISEEQLKELTSENKWYQSYVNQILNYASNMDADDEL